MALFSPSTSAFTVSNIPQVLYIYLHLRAALTRKTKAPSPGTLEDCVMRMNTLAY